MNKECDVIWSKCLELIREHIVPSKYKILFEPIKALRFANNVLTIQVASAYVYEALEGDYIDILKSALKTVIGPTAKLEYSVIVEQSKKRNDIAVTMSSTNVQKPAVSTVKYDNHGKAPLRNPFEVPTNTIRIDSQLNPSYSMDAYIEGGCNRLARSAGMAIAEKPGKTAFNPLVIYGNSGLGKTHLAQAIGLEVKQRHPEKVVLYLSTNLFQTQYVEAVRRNEVNDFLHFYQLIDVLILDDIQEFAGKPGTQNTFFHIFNHLHQSGRQLILTADKSPAEMSGMEDRLLSRFRWGLTAEIKSPDFDTRKEIILNKARKDGIEFSDDVIEYLCKYVNNNVRELEGAMISLLAQSTFNKRELTLDVVRESLEKIVKSEVSEITVDKIQNVVCNYFNITNEMLKAKTRKREIVQARQLAMYLSKTYTSCSLASIGSQIGNKDHATVLYACKAVNDLISTDKQFKTNVEEIQKQLFYSNL
ncbi:MAG: chromosomal replication initiator protein DnaA [Marinifilaceae bacterium]